MNKGMTKLLVFTAVLFSIYNILNVLNKKSVRTRNEIPQVNIEISTSNNDTRTTLATTGFVFDMQAKKRKFIPKSMALNNSFRMDSYPYNDKWVVLTTIFQPTNLIKTLMTMKQWCIVIVGDLKSLSREKYLEQLGIENEACLIYLSLQEQNELGYAILKYIPINSFGRKNIGYIFAVQHGARIIYDTDDDNEISDPELMNYWSIKNWRLGHDALFQWRTTGSNPYPTYGVNDIWPRGLPLDEIKIKETFKSQPVTENIIKEEICIVQSLANSEPDVDAIYRLTNKNYPLMFKSDQIFACQIERDSIAPFNAQATMIFKEAFSTMLLPVTVHGRVSDIWRAYIAQKVLHCSLVFSYPWVTQIRNSHNYLADFEAEIPLYLQASAFVKYLLGKKEKYSTIVDAITDAYEHGILESQDVDLAFAWQHDIEKAQQIASTSQGIVTDNKPFKHLVIAMGKGYQLRQWKELIMNHKDIQHVDIILGVFDEPVERLECGATSRIICVSLESTTWTTGRNKLARLAYQTERLNLKNYTYWTFIDADITLQCLLKDLTTVTSNNECFVKYDLVLKQLMHPVVFLIDADKFPFQDNAFFVKIEAFDAACNSFHRNSIPVLLPYQSDLDHVSWWSSQAIFWYRVRCFTPLYATSPLSVFMKNQEHDPYPREPRPIKKEMSIGQRMLGNLSKILQKPPLDFPDQFTAERIKPLDEIKEYNWMDELDAYNLCMREFSNGFHKFISK